MFSKFIKFKWIAKVTPRNRSIRTGQIREMAAEKVSSLHSLAQSHELLLISWHGQCHDELIHSWVLIPLKRLRGLRIASAKEGRGDKGTAIGKGGSLVSSPFLGCASPEASADSSLNQDSTWLKQ